MKKPIFRFGIVALGASLSGCSLFWTAKSDGNYPDVAQTTPPQVRYVGVDKIEARASRVLAPTAERQFVLNTTPPARAPAPVPLTKEVRAKPAPKVEQTPKPEPVAPKPVEHGTIAIRFAFDSATLTHESESSLDEKMEDLRVAGEIVIVGHTDSRGPDTYNQVLSMRRGEAVRSYLQSKGVPAASMHVKGEGEHHPVATNKTNAGRAQNRRVVISY